ncbi:MAG: metallophosphoesterase family protein [Cyanobacteria bacterium SZAS-4]|nr:metallophosphoesterase family protein [Cyanobacteria bacterium SZAS-4]
MTLTVASFICIAYAFFVEPYNLQINYIKLSLDDLPASAKPIRIVQVSDTHCDSTIRLENRVADEIEKIKPDLILFTGDAVNSLDGQKNFNEFAAKLLRVAPTLAVKGDWDFAFDVDVLKDSKLELIPEYKIVKINGTELCIVGADSGSSCGYPLRNSPKGVPKIVMYHNPDADIILNNETDGVDLYLCGHTHGGQISLPFYGALITQSKQGKKYESGLHKLGSTNLYTNRGIGMEGHFPRLRFCARPELTVFELTGTRTAESKSTDRQN